MGVCLGWYRHWWAQQWWVLMQGVDTQLCSPRQVHGVLTFGDGGDGKLGHGTDTEERLPRAVEALVRKSMVGVSAGFSHTSVWTEHGELFTWGHGHGLVHRGPESQHTPQLVEGLAGKMVVGAAAGEQSTAAWRDAGELYSFGYG